MATVAKPQPTPEELAQQAVSLTQLAYYHEEFQAAEANYATATAQRVASIRKCLAAGVRVSAIAQRIGVSPQRVSQLAKQRDTQT